MGGSPATPLRLSRHKGGTDEQDTAPDQADGDDAALALATGMRCAGARRCAPLVGRAVGVVVGTTGGGVGEQMSAGVLSPPICTMTDRP